MADSRQHARLAEAGAASAGYLYRGDVLMIAPQPCFEPRGTPMNVQQMCQALSQFGYHVHLLTYPYGRDVDIPGLTYHRVRRLPLVKRVPIGFSRAKIMLDALICWEMVKLLLVHRFAAVHAVEESALFAAPLARLFRVPVITDLDSDLLDQLGVHRRPTIRFMARIVRPLQKLMLWNSTCALTVCQSLTDLVAELAPGKPAFQIEDIPMFSADRQANPSTIRAIREELGLGSRRVVLYTGNLQHYQGVDLLIEAMPEVVRRYPDVALVIVGGEGGEVRRANQRAEELGVASSVFLVGKRPPDEIPDFMGMAEVLVSPRREGGNTPLKVYTYMMSGRVLVATDLETHTQVLDEHNAILTAVSPQGLAAGMIRALDDPEAGRCLATRAREKVEREHNHQVFRSKLKAVYDFVIEKGHRPASALLR